MSKAAETRKSLSAMDAVQLAERSGELGSKLFNLRFQLATGQVENHREIREIRKDMARIKTYATQVAKGAK